MIVKAFPLEVNTSLLWALNIQGLVLYTWVAKMKLHPETKDHLLVPKTVKQAIWCGVLVFLLLWQAYGMQNRSSEKGWTLDSRRWTGLCSGLWTGPTPTFYGRTYSKSISLFAAKRLFNIATFGSPIIYIVSFLDRIRVVSRWRYLFAGLEYCTHF